MLRRRTRSLGLAAFTALAGSVIVVSPGSASAPPVGPSPPGPTAAIQTRAGELVAFALPARSNGRVWRIANTVDGKVIREVSEGDLGNQVVLVFKAVGPGKATVAFGLTRGERSAASESRRFVVSVRS
jgi:hypothetical protein